MLHENWNIVAMIIGSIGAIGYLIDTLKGRAKPNRVSWFLWGLAPLIAFFAQLSEGVKLSSLLTFTVGAFPVLIFLASFVSKGSAWKIKKLDYLCGSLSVIGLILWMISGHGMIAIFFSIMADALASIPTVYKSFHHPESETYLIYLLGIVQALITLFTLTSWNLATAGFPVYIFLIDVTLFVLIRFKIGRLFLPNLARKHQ